MRLTGRAIGPGRASGVVLASPHPFSFLGGVNAETGALLDDTGNRLAGRVFAFPHGKGSTVGSYVLYGLSKRGIGPAAIVNERAETIVAVGAILAGIPIVDRVDVHGLQTGDRATVDGDRGHVELPGVRAQRVVSAVLRNRGRILIVRRSLEVGSFLGHWSVVSGHLEGREDPADRARREIREETHVRYPVLRAESPPLLARHESTMYVVHPFLFDVPSRRVRLDWENMDSRWIRPKDLRRFKTVPRLADVVSTVLNRV